MTHLLSDIDIITPNETEASFLSGVTITDINDAKKAGNIILQSGVKKVIVPLAPVVLCSVSTPARCIFLHGAPW